MLKLPGHIVPIFDYWVIVHLAVGVSFCTLSALNFFGSSDFNSC